MPDRSSFSPFRADWAAVAVELPTDRVENALLASERAEATTELLLQRIGVRFRHIAADGETALDLAERACRKLFRDHPELPALVDTLIFCTQSPDHILPPNSCLLHGRLELAETVAVFDLSHACSGFVYGLHLVQALIESGKSQHLLLITADTYSRYIHPQDWSAKLLFGDAAAVSWFRSIPASEGRGIMDVALGTAGRHFDKFYIPAGGCRLPVSDELRQQQVRDSSGNVRTPTDIHMAGRDVLSFVGTSIPPHIEMVLARNGLTIDDIDWFVFHQASRVVLDTLAQLLSIDAEHTLESLSQYGNTVSASIPLTIHTAQQAGRVASGQQILLCGFGAGLSWGTALYCC